MGLLLERSRRKAGTNKLAMRTTPLIKALERRSLPVLLQHRDLKKFVQNSMFKAWPEHDFLSVLYQLPGDLFWSFTTSTILLWATEPFRLILDRLLEIVMHSAMQHAST